jgi:hypothetical protein
MWKKIREALPVVWPLLQAKDLATGEVSFRLWCAWWSFHLALLSVIALHFFPVSTASWTAIGFYALSMVFYMLKKLTSAKIDLDDRSVELNNSESQEKTE